MSIADSLLLSKDWTSTAILPVVVTQEEVALLPGVWKHYRTLMQDLHDLPMQDQILPARFLCTRDIERLPDLVQHHDVMRLLAEWAHHPQYNECTLAHFLQETGKEVFPNFMKARLQHAISYLADELGLKPPEWEGDP